MSIKFVAHGGREHVLIPDARPVPGRSSLEHEETGNPPAIRPRSDVLRAGTASAPHAPHAAHRWLLKLLVKNPGDLSTRGQSSG